MTNWKLLGLVVVAVLVVGCGGSKKADAEEPSGTSVLGVGGPPAADQSGQMIPPEQMDAVDQAFKRKEPVISRCLANAMERREVPKGTHGRIALEVVIAAGGKATSVKINKSEIEAQTVKDCVIKHVEEISFPDLPKQYETSHTYAMEAN
jgi:hypothetical protein